MHHEAAVHRQQLPRRYGGTFSMEDMQHDRTKVGDVSLSLYIINTYKGQHPEGY